jgi:hypothetical protein
MTQRNIDVMDIIVSKMAEGDKFSRALERVYNKRSVCIPHNDEDFNVSVTDIGLSSRAIRILIRTKLMTVGAVVDFCNMNNITDIVNMGKNTGIEVFESILDYCWEHMDQKERIAFLIDIVERNSDNIREGIA